MDVWLKDLPKCELHLHIEGTLEPEMMFELAARNNVALPYADVAAVRTAYEFDCLQAFLDLYYAGCAVLVTERDFHDLMLAYLRRAHADGVVYAEVFFDPQSHTARGVPMATVVNGLRGAIDEARASMGIDAQLIMCFLRHLSEESAIETLGAALPFKQHILGVGLDSGEHGHPPLKFQRAYAEAKAAGFHLVAHCCEEGPPQNALDALSMHVERIDHGVRALESDECVRVLRERRVPLTVCPLSNLRLKVNERYFDGKCCVRRLLDAGLMVTINSDDPSYFGGYVNDNYMHTIAECGLTGHEVVMLAENSVDASFLPPDAKRAHRDAIAAYVAATPPPPPPPPPAAAVGE